MVKEKPGLEKVREDYQKLQDKYNLPSFESLNHEFYIEKVAETETEILTREIRRFIADKIYNYLRFIETVLNPVNAPMFIFSVIKSMSQEDKKKLSDVYNKLSEINLDLIKLDIDSNEKKDAEFIIKVYNSWQSIKKELLFVIEKFKNNNEIKEEKSSSKYFG